MSSENLLALLAGLKPDQVIVSGYAGCGYSLLTERFGDAVHVGDLGTQVLVVMRRS